MGRQSVSGEKKKLFAVPVLKKGRSRLPVSRKSWLLKPWIEWVTARPKKSERQGVA